MSYLSIEFLRCSCFLPFLLSFGSSVKDEKSSISLILFLSFLGYLALIFLYWLTGAQHWLLECCKWCQSIHTRRKYMCSLFQCQLGRGFQFPALNNWEKPPDSVHSPTSSLRHFQPWFPASQEGQARRLGPMFTLSVGFADFCGICFSHGLLIFSLGAPPQPVVEKPPITCLVGKP